MSSRRHRALVRRQAVRQEFYASIAEARRVLHKSRMLLAGEAFRSGLISIESYQQVLFEGISDDE